MPRRRVAPELHPAAFRVRSGFDLALSFGQANRSSRAILPAVHGLPFSLWAFYIVSRKYGCQERVSWRRPAINFGEGTPGPAEQDTDIQKIVPETDCHRFLDR